MKLTITAIIAAVIGFGIAYVLPGNSSGMMQSGESNEEMDQSEMEEGMDDSMSGMDGMMLDMEAMPPPVKGFAQEEKIHFIHTEASDKKIAGMLEDMMGSPVFTVQSLAEVSEEALANVYVFKNGVEGDGPFGFQPDVLDHPPETEDYSPLRELNVVTWKDAESAETLKSAAQVKEAREEGKLTVKQPGVVINMPMVTWPEGQR